MQISSQTGQTLAGTVGGRVVKSYAYSQSGDALPTRCAGLDLTFDIAQGGGHVPGGFEPTAWCYLSTVGGNPSSSACPSQPSAATATATATPMVTTTPTATPTPTSTPKSNSGSTATATKTATATVAGTPTPTSTPGPTPTGLSPRAYLPALVA